MYKLDIPNRVARFPNGDAPERIQLTFKGIHIAYNVTLHRIDRYTMRWCK